MYICPLCEKKYKPDEVPANCAQCKRPLILNGRWRIEISVDKGPYGQDFDATDLKKDTSVILRELAIKKRDLGARKEDVERYEENRSRLKGKKYDGNKVLLDAFDAETKNSKCFYLVFDADAWAMLGNELYLGSGGGEEDLPPVEGRDLDPELEAMLAKLPSDGEKKKDSGGSALAKTDGDALPAKKKEGGSALATRSKVIIGVSLLAIVGAAIAVFFLI